MKAYFYFSKINISKINNVDEVKQSIAKAIADSFNLLSEVNINDVSIRCAQIANGIDVFFVIDTMITNNTEETVKGMETLKILLYRIIQQDQRKTIAYNIRTRIDKSHVPLGSDYTGAFL